MSFFEDAIIGVKDIGAAVGKKTGKMVDTAKLRMSAAEINNEIKKRYELLGKAVYEARKSDTSIDGIVDECVVSIDALMDRLDEVNDRIAGLSNKISCPSCGQTLAPKSLYCSRCGARIDTRKRAAAPKAEQAAEAAEVGEEE